MSSFEAGLQPRIVAQIVDEPAAENDDGDDGDDGRQVLPHAQPVLGSVGRRRPAVWRHGIAQCGWRLDATGSQPRARTIEVDDLHDNDRLQEFRAILPDDGFPLKDEV
jgi:hypothetical protein